MDKAIFFRAFMVGIVVRCACPRWGRGSGHHPFLQENHGISLPSQPDGDGHVFMPSDTLSEETRSASKATRANNKNTQTGQASGLMRPINAVAPINAAQLGAVVR
jgi:hypothetical protein